MSKINFIKILVFLMVPLNTFCQINNYSIKPVSFNSPDYDDFSPVWYNTGIIFCSNRQQYNLVKYYNSKNKPFVDIFFADSVSDDKSVNPVLFNQELNTILNDGPVTFNRELNKIWFSRNINVKGTFHKLNDSTNILGLFYASLTAGNWTDIKTFEHNGIAFSNTTPFFSPDNSRLYFASDRPGGYGGTDLYYCYFNGEQYSDPVNMGPAINSRGNELFPFINDSNELYFSSDGHHGLGNKDIFKSVFTGADWCAPVNLGAPINSENDDFGFITDRYSETGYFSSNRLGTDDIFYFRLNYPLFRNCTEQKENIHCFIFNVENAYISDSIPVTYKWDFDDGVSDSGLQVKHCFAGEGSYLVKLNVIQESTVGELFAEAAYKVVIVDFEQPYIYSPDTALLGDAVKFDGLKSKLPDFNAEKYFWRFGDGVISEGPEVFNTYLNEGSFRIDMEIYGRLSESNELVNKCISKKIFIKPIH